MTTRWVLGNWKQNLLAPEAAECAQGIARGLATAIAANRDLRVGIAPPYLSLAATAPACRPHSAMWLLAQDCAAQESGAFTGEVGPAMLAAAAVELTLVGHSERRALYSESSAMCAKKVRAALDGGLGVVLCVGEALEARDSGTHENVVISQLWDSLSQIELEDFTERLVIAYEPVWAIGTGRTATPAQASAMHRALRAQLRERFGDAGADRSILYGGSVKPTNAGELMAAGDIDGFLVGGASLVADTFLSIVKAAAEAEVPSA